MHAQESLDGTQAEADALMEEAANAFMHGASDEAEGCLLLNISTTTLHEVVGALGRPYHTWRSQVSTALQTMIHCTMLDVTWCAKYHDPCAKPHNPVR